MTRRRFYAPATAFSDTQNSVTLVADEARHLREVLRLKPGDEVYVFNVKEENFSAASKKAGAMTLVSKSFAKLNRHVPNLHCT
jgi:16S rRNA U1498 N3-methylase RsmE